MKPAPRPCQQLIRQTAGTLTLASSLAVLLLAAPALAQSNQWTGAVNGDFNTPGNWSSGPPTGNVVLDFRPNRPVVNGPATVGTATVNTSMDIAATGRLTASALSQTAGTLDNAGTLNAGSVIQNSGVITNRATGLISGGVANGTSSTLTNAGTITGGVTVAAQGMLSNDSGLVTGGLDNAGTVSSSGAIQGDIANRGTGSFTATGSGATGNGTFANTDQATLTVRSRLTGLTALTNSSTAAVGVSVEAGATLSADSVTNAADSTIVVRGNLASAAPIQNTGTLSVLAAGIVNGGVTNAGNVFNDATINGGLTSTGTVTNTQSGTINGAVRAAGNFANAGTINDALEVVDGLFDNTGRLRDTVTVIGGRLVSVAPRSQIQNGLINSATADVAGVMTGPIQNLSGGRINILGDTAGDGTLNNQSGATLALTGGNLAGMNTIDNGGTLLASGTRTLGTAGLNNLSTGTISTQNGMTGDSLTINGPYNGTAGSRLAIDVDLSKGAATPADRIVVNGTASGNSSLSITNTGASHGLLAAPIEVVTVGAGSSLSLTRGRVAALPFVNYTLEESAPGSGSYQLTSQFNSAPLASIASGLSGALAAASTSLHHPLHPVISRPVGCAENEFVASPFLRMTTGNDRMSGASTIDGPGGTTNPSGRTNGTTSAMQGGLDFGLCNIGGSRWNLHAGLSAGQISTSATATSTLPGTAGSVASVATSTVKLDVPFLALHALAARDGFNLEVAIRREDINATLATAGDGNTYVESGTKLKSGSWTFNGLASYRFALPYAFFIEPHIGASKGSASFKPMALATGSGDTLAFSAADTGYVRAGLNVGTSLRLGEGAIISPFAHFSLWSSLGSAMNGRATLASIGESATVKGEAGGAFSQIGGGVMMRTLGGGLSGFIRGDARFGGKMQGQALSAGLRATF